MKKWISKSECTQKTEWNKPFLKILTFWLKSKFYLVKAFFFFFLQAVRTGSGFRVGPSQTGVVEDDVIHDIMRRGHVSALGASSAWLGEVARETGTDDVGGAWLILWA